MIVKYIDVCEKTKHTKAFDLAAKIYSLDNDLDNDLDTKHHFECVATIELSLDRSNENIDLFKMDIENIPSFDFLFSTLPCPPIAILEKIIKIICYHKPRHILLETPHNIVSLENGDFMTRLKDIFDKIGYSMAYKKMNAQDFGVPQSRERVYIACVNSGLSPLRNRNIPFKFDAATSYAKKCVPKVVKDILDHDEEVKNHKGFKPDFIEKIVKLHQQRSVLGYKLGDKRGGDKNIHSWDLDPTIGIEEKTLMNLIITQRRKKHWAKKKDVPWTDGLPLTKEDIMTFYPHRRLEEMLTTLTQKNYLRREKCKLSVNGRRVYKEDSPEGYNICKGKLSFEIQRILDPESPCPTLVPTDAHKLAVLYQTNKERERERDKEIGNNTIIRPLNTKELKRIAGCPEDFNFPDKVNPYEFFGHMTCPPVIVGILHAFFTT